MFKTHSKKEKNLTSTPVLNFNVYIKIKYPSDIVNFKIGFIMFTQEKGIKKKVIQYVTRMALKF